MKSTPLSTVLSNSDPLYFIRQQSQDTSFSRSGRRTEVTHVAMQLSRHNSTVSNALLNKSFLMLKIPASTLKEKKPAQENLFATKSCNPSPRLVGRYSSLHRLGKNRSHCRFASGTISLYYSPPFLELQSLRISALVSNCTALFTNKLAGNIRRGGLYH